MKKKEHIVRYTDKELRDYLLDVCMIEIKLRDVKLLKVLF